MVEFDEQVAAQLEAVYQTRDVVRRRQLVFEALDPRPGDRVLDLGCGPGFYVAEALELVGAQGAVVGVDPAPAMRAMTERRVEGAANAEVLDGGATAIPLDDDSVDRALSVQVLEYVADVEAALAELHRVLRPGGRLVIWDVDWSTLSWHAEDADRAARVLAAWDGHVAHPALPRRLGGLLRAGGFADVGCAGHAFTTIDADLQTYGGLAAPMVAQWLETVEDPALAQDGRGWVEEQRRLGEQGAYFFSVTQCCFTATRPA